VPGERSSGEKRRIGRITKAGNSRVRYLLVEAAWRILRSKGEETAALRAWAFGIAQRRGKRIVAVALARRLAGILYAMWRDGEAYQASRLRPPRARDSPRRAESRVRPRGIEMTESGAASALQLMAAVESRELVSAVRSFRRPKCAEARGLTGEREQKAEQQLERRGQSAKRQRQVHTTLDAGRRFTESCKGFS